MRVIRGDYEFTVNFPCLCVNVVNLRTGECEDSLSCGSDMNQEELELFANAWLNGFR